MPKAVNLHHLTIGSFKTPASGTLGKKISYEFIKPVKVEEFYAN
jgi:hypothetical protein